MKIYHNPRCGKSREGLAILRNHGIEPEIILYLKDTPTASELKEVLEKLGMAPLALIRKKEPIFKELYRGKELSDAEWIKAMVEHPKLIERPIVVDGNRAVLGRPPEKIKELFS